MHILIIYILLGIIIGFFLKPEDELQWALVVVSWPVVLFIVFCMHLGAKLIGWKNVD